MAYGDLFRDYTAFNSPFGGGNAMTPPGGAGRGIFAQPTAGEAADVLSATRGGRQMLFDRAMAASPFANYITPLASGMMERRFNPMSASYLMESLNPTPGTQAGLGNFRSFINPGSSQTAYTPPYQASALAAPSQQDYWRGGLQRLSDPFTRMRGREDMSIGDEATMAGLTGENEGAAANLLLQAMMSGVNPLLGRTMGDILNRRFEAWRDTDPTTSLFERFSPVVQGELANRIAARNTGA